MLTQIFFYFFTVLGIFFFISVIWDSIFNAKESLDGDHFRNSTRNNFL